MTKRIERALRELPREQLIYLIDKMRHSLGVIGEICVDESKWHITSEQAIEQIRKNIYDFPCLYDVEESKREIQTQMNNEPPKKEMRIETVEEFFKRNGVEIDDL